jgi:hypothetical protein
MGQITISGVATFGTTTLSTSIVLEAQSVQQGVLTADTTYEQVAETLITGSGTPQAVAIYNSGTVDVAVRLQYSSTKYYFLNAPPGCVILVPTSVKDGTALVDWEILSVKTVSGTADVEYVVIR